MSRGWQKFWLIVATLVCGAAAPASAIFAIISPIAFDRAGSLLNPLAWIAFLLMVTLWVVCILAPWAAWVTFMRKQSKLAWTLISTPPIWAGIMGLTLIFLPG